MAERRVIKQVKSGFKILAAILFSFGAFSLVGIAYVSIIQDSPKLSHGSAWVLLVAMVMLMFVTVRFWARWFCGIISYLALRSMLLPLFAGSGSLSDLPFRSAVAITASFWLMAILSIHFYRRHHFSILDQFSITGAATSLFIGFIRLGSAGNNGIILPVLMGIPLLVLSSYQKPLKHLTHKPSRNDINRGPTRPDFL
jgi:hypothetical protein